MHIGRALASPVPQRVVCSQAAAAGTPSCNTSRTRPARRRSNWESAMICIEFTACMQRPHHHHQSTYLIAETSVLQALLRTSGRGSCADCVNALSSFVHSAGACSRQLLACWSVKASGCAPSGDGAASLAAGFVVSVMIKGSQT